MQGIKTLIMASCLTLALAGNALADDMANPHSGEHLHGSEIYSMFLLETDYGIRKGDDTANWDMEGWIGTDENKLWLKSEGEYSDGKLEEGEAWVLYSRNIATFWDAQAGIRQDFGENTTTYAVFGLTGLARYYFETEAHLFISDKGHVSARLRQENDLLLTQKLILQPYAEVNLYLQDAPESDAGAGIGDGKIGLQTRYEFTRKFAPYIDVHYGKKFGETASIARSDGEETNELVGAIGLRLMF